ncbi:MAG: cysteine synthase B [Polyangiales bacterium]|jgi:cysteine synthase B
MTGTSITDRIGSTPLVELPTGTDNPEVRLLGKMEGNNPGSSVKDRAAWSMVRRAEERGDLKKGMTLIEPTSGNTGIALAMIAAARGFDIELVMPASSTAERVKTMRALGAKVVLTPADGGMESAIDFARARAASGNYLMLDQFSNGDNWRAHYESTGPEIWRDTNGEITHFVSAMGTTGTIMGVSRYLKEQNEAVRIVGLQPEDGSRIPGIRRWPKEYLPKIFEAERVDEVIDLNQEDAEVHARLLATKHGIFVGASAAGAALGAQRVAAKLERGLLVCILCDRGDRYLSSPLFDGAGELEIIQ